MDPKVAAATFPRSRSDRNDRGLASMYAEDEAMYVACAARAAHLPYKPVDCYDQLQEKFLKYHRGCTCSKCGCDDPTGCNCLWEGGCMYVYGQFGWR